MRGRSIVVLAIVGTLGLSVQAAGAFEFIPSKAGQTEGPFTTRGGSGSAGKQQLALEPFTLQCSIAHTRGSASSTTLTVVVRLSRCTASAEESAVSEPARLTGPLVLSYDATNANATLQQPATVDIPSLKCTIMLAAGELYNGYEKGGSASGGAGAGKVIYPFFNLAIPTLNLRTFPTGVRNAVEIRNEQQGISYSFGRSCAALQSGDEGVYSGATLQEVIGGNLEVTTPAEETEEGEEET